MKVCIVVGTRPEIVKMSCVIHQLVLRKVPFVVVHSGQHYDSELSDLFFEELELSPPDFNLQVGSGSHARQTASAMIKLEEVFKDVRPDIVLVEGDTNTVLAGALTGVKLGIQVGHVEAGLRSYDLRMPEEHNRRLADHLSSYLFAPTKRAAETLHNESCWGKVYQTGNTVIDACLRFGQKAQQFSSVLKKLDYGRFALATTHRAENVDDPVILQEFAKLFVSCPIPVIYPVHPRTLQRLREGPLYKTLKNSANVMLFPALGYLDFLNLLINCEFVLTDSGGIQEEVTAPNIRKKAFVLRHRTERPEAVEAGYAEVVGTEAKSALEAIERFMESNWSPKISSPFGNGGASSQIIDAIEEQIKPMAGLCTLTPETLIGQTADA